MQTSEQVRKRWSVGSGELPGENPVELSAQHPMLQFAIDGVGLTIGELGRMDELATKAQKARNGQAGSCGSDRDHCNHGA